jgi:hypothetical protein
MIKIIRDSLHRLVYCWRKPVMDHFGPQRENGCFMIVISTQHWFKRSSNSARNWCQSGNSQPTPDQYTPMFIQIPIVTRYFALT